MATQSFHILQMSKHFLYLPLYFAERHGFFGYLPSDCKVVIDQPTASHTDVATYEQMIDQSPDYRDFVMAVTDPMQALQTPLGGTESPAILATLVTNAAFWAVDHGHHTTRNFRDLGSFDKIIAYAKGTTSYDIAARIARSCSPPRPLDTVIRVVEPGKELLLLSQLHADDNTVALSPDILHIEEMVGRQCASVELALGETHEYNDVLVAALLSTKTFVKAHPDVIRGVLAALEYALRMIHLRDPSVLSFARDYFHFSDRAAGAIDKAIKANVLPSSIRVARPHWMRASQAHQEAKISGRKWSLDSEAVAADYFDACVSPYDGLREDAIVMSQALPERNHPKLFANNSGVAIALSAVVVAMASLASRRTGLIAMGVAISIWAGVYIARGRLRLMHSVYWTSLILGILVLALISIPSLRDQTETLLSIGLAFLLPAGFELVKLYSSDRGTSDGH